MRGWRTMKMQSVLPSLAEHNLAIELQQMKANCLTWRLLGRASRRWLIVWMSQTLTINSKYSWKEASSSPSQLGKCLIISRLKWTLHARWTSARTSDLFLYLLQASNSRFEQLSSISKTDKWCTRALTKTLASTPQLNCKVNAILTTASSITCQQVPNISKNNRAKVMENNLKQTWTSGLSIWAKTNKSMVPLSSKISKLKSLATW